MHIHFFPTHIFHFSTHFFVLTVLGFVMLTGIQWIVHENLINLAVFAGQFAQKLFGKNSLEFCLLSIELYCWSYTVWMPAYLFMHQHTQRRAFFPLSVCVTNTLCPFVWYTHSLRFVRMTNSNAVSILCPLSSFRCFSIRTFCNNIQIFRSNLFFIFLKTQSISSGS